MNERCIIVHPQMGVFLGHSMGFGFFSNIDPAGQLMAPVFATKAEGHECISRMACDAEVASTFSLFTVPLHYPGEYVDTLVMKAIGVPEEMLTKILEAEAFHRQMATRVGVAPKLN